MYFIIVIIIIISYGLKIALGKVFFFFYMLKNLMTVKISPTAVFCHLAGLFVLI